MKYSVIGVAAACWLTACSPTIQVRSDYDRGADFRGYRTYAVVSAPGANPDPVMGSQLMQKRITQALENEMNARGYKESQQPDLLIRFETDARNLQQIQSMNTGPMWGWWWGNNNNVSSRNYEENRLIISLLDARTKEMVWQGWAKGELNARKKNRDELIRETVARVMEEYPHRAGFDNSAAISDRK
ncbi:DUF4136 domain-containing protein [Siphonobacter aquaeclarae]|uniref:DUF4136 domain-containing protein n=1 Tax=Siphonobacter aquaeclarae TaxID=563176 RepID=A0A1G9UJ45_9BACT|nr:DUF4136 domain-containing protein [Siphonobacter aquaeclarae]SDM59565.1 protein of unknown function [Siphonobacter aquaeclarae]